MVDWKDWICWNADDIQMPLSHCSWSMRTMFVFELFGFLATEQVGWGKNQEGSREMPATFFLMHWNCWLAQEVRRSFKAVQKCLSEWKEEAAAMLKGQLLFRVHLRELILLEWTLDTYSWHLLFETEFHPMKGAKKVVVTVESKHC